jgi:hypothetical protein
MRRASVGPKGQMQLVQPFSLGFGRLIVRNWATIIRCLIGRAVRGGRVSLLGGERSFA